MNEPTSAFPRLFSPFRLRHLTLKNRIVTTPHGAAFAMDGKPTETYLRYIVDRAQGGCSLIGCFGGASVHPTSRVGTWPEIRYWDDGIIPFLLQISKAVHPHGAYLVAQLMHRGSKAWSIYEGAPSIAPSYTVAETMRETPQPMSKRDVRSIVEAYATAARRVQAGGFDGCDVPVIGGCLLEQFLSELHNERDDEYGGNLENRARFLCQVLAAIRDAAGPHFIIGVRLSGDQEMFGGVGLEDIKEVARLLERDSLADYVSVTGSSYETIPLNAALTPSLYHPPLTYQTYARAIKNGVNIPVIYATRVTAPQEAEGLLQSDSADLVAMTRALISDPDLPKKAAAGRLRDIRLCIGASEGCISRNRQGLPIRCVQNPIVGHETEIPELRPAEHSRRVVVVGGGAAGLEAARVLASRGHSVILLERSTELGGQLNILARAPGRGNWRGAATWLINQVRDLKVEVQLNTEATAATIKGMGVDCVLVATGAKQRPFSLPGDRGIPVSSAVDVLAGGEEVFGQGVAIYDREGYMHAASAAEYLADLGKTVSIISPTWTIGEDIDIGLRSDVYSRLLKKKLTLIPQTRIVSTYGTRLTLENIFSRYQTNLQADHLVIAIGQLPNNSLFHELHGKIKELHLVGDSIAPRRLHDALLSATMVARQI